MAHILIADDSATMRLIISQTLQRAGWRVESARNGQEALHSARLRRPDLVVSDLNMPVLDGLGFIRGLRADEALQHLPVLVLTTEDDNASKQAARALGVASWIYKPVDPTLLVERVRAHLPENVAQPLSETGARA